MVAGDESMTLQVPVVDISQLVTVENDADLIAALNIPGGPLSDVINSIRAAATEWEFFYIRNHGFTPEKIENLRSIARQFFAPSKEVKKRIRRSPDHFFSYFDSELTKNIDWKEVFNFEGQHREVDAVSNSSDSVGQLLCTNMWLPDEALPNFKRTLCDYCDSTEKMRAD